MDSAALRDTAPRKSSGKKAASAKGGVRSADADDKTLELLPVSVPSGTNNIKIQATTVVHSSGKKTAKFNISTDSQHAYEGGVTLIFEKPGHAATITWYLDSGISSLSSSSPYVAFSAASGGQQSLTTEAHTYKALLIPFLVNFVTGEQHDPMIIVTPIGGGPPPHLPGDPAKKRSSAKGKASAVAAKAKAKAKAKRAKPAAASKRNTASKRKTAKRSKR